MNWKKTTWVDHEGTSRVVVMPITQWHVRTAITIKHLENRKKFLKEVEVLGGANFKSSFEALEHLTMQEAIRNAHWEQHLVVDEFHSVYDDTDSDSFHHAADSDPVCTLTDMVTLTKVHKIIAYHKKFGENM